MTDVDGAAVEEAASSLGDSATGLAVDVRDADAIRKVVENVAREHGHLDYLFNNAGIAIGGVAQELSAEHYRRAIDVNIYGVVNGVLAAYPLMVTQGSGYILNTASVAGLLPSLFSTPYAMTKHAIVGLSKNLRLEGEHYGVRVSVLCPGVIDTPILDSEDPADLSSAWSPVTRDFLTKFSGPPASAGELAEYTLDAMERNRGMIVFPRVSRVSAWLYRLSPGLIDGTVRKAIGGALKSRSQT
jgi:NAD(P)-dependent dehydrogenase (short-subunit alcohol dehydrogenase family)